MIKMPNFHNLPTKVFNSYLDEVYSAVEANQGKDDIFKTLFRCKILLCFKHEFRE